jgi:hypothetical protein
MTCISSALLIILKDWESVNTNGCKIISRNHKSSILVGINTVNISSICSFRENSLDLPTKFACSCLPDWGINQRYLTILLRSAFLYIVKLFCVSLINCSYEFWVSWPINSQNSWCVNIYNRPMMIIFSTFQNFIDVNRIVVGSDRKILFVWWIYQNFAPFFWFVNRCNSFGEIVLIQDCNISIIVTDCNMIPLFTICNSSSLLLGRMTAHWSSSWLNLCSFIWFSSEEFCCPNLSLFYHFFFGNTEFINGIIITACQKCSFIWNNLKSPWFSIIVWSIYNLSVCTIYIHSLNFSIFMANENFSI